MGAMEILRKKPKVNHFLIFLILCGGLLVAAGPGLSPLAYAKSTGTFNAPESFSRLAEMASPAVVNIRIEKTVKSRGPSMRQFQRDPWGREKPFKDFFERFFGEDAPREFKQPSVGSGFIIDKSGYVVTNNHVIENADKIVVKLDDDNELDAKVVGRDPNTDIALLKVESDLDFPFIKLGDSKKLKIGQWVVAIGSPFGLERTVTAGIVSAKGRVIGSGPYDDFIQTDASINPGNSGGPLLNMDGEVVGINTAIIASASGIGFAIPISLAQGIIAQLKSEGEVTRGWLGVAIQDLTGEMAEYYGLKDRKGVLVADVFKGDPADEAGIRAKDIILEVNDQKIETSRQLTGMIAGLKVGQVAKIEVFRDRKIKIFSIKLAKRDDTRLKAQSPPQEPKEEDELGVRVADLTAEMAQQFNIEDMTGVVVVGVASDSKGAEAGIQMGDIIKEINHRVIESVDDYKTALQKIKEGDSVNLFVWRRNAGFLVIKVTK
ncbi:HtrA protease/chaperone protein [Olavius sp. associated proteobacterium Delta 1]|nr:HtrA protease/chaperone protein [Olavius sp. associated proteobacterium Delta 1]